MIRTRIHVRRDLIAKDRKQGTTSLVIGVETLGMKKRYGHAVTLYGPSMVVYNPEKPLKCGARVWIETYSPIEVHAK